MVTQAQPKGQPIAKIVTRKEYHCPSCRAMLSSDDFTSYVINCTTCNAKIKLPDLSAGKALADNERLQMRCPVALKIQYENAIDFKVDYTKNVSQGGMFIQTASPFEIGTKMQLELFLPDLNEPLLMSIEVVHRHIYEDDDTQEGVGVRFIDIDPLSKSILINYLSAISNCS